MLVKKGLDSQQDEAGIVSTSNPNNSGCVGEMPGEQPGFQSIFADDRCIDDNVTALCTSWSLHT